MGNPLDTIRDGDILRDDSGDAEGDYLDWQEYEKWYDEIAADYTNDWEGR